MPSRPHTRDAVWSLPTVRWSRFGDRWSHRWFEWLLEAPESCSGVSVFLNADDGVRYTSNLEQVGAAGFGTPGPYRASQITRDENIAETGLASSSWPRCCWPAAWPAAAQNPVRWSATAAPKALAPGGRFDVSLVAVADEGWHVYSVTQGPGGPIPTTVTIPSGQPFSIAGAIGGTAPATAFDPNFEIQTETYEGTFTLVVPVRLLPDAPVGGADLRVAVRFQACTSRLCLPPRTVTLTVPVKWTGGRTGVASAPESAVPPPASSAATVAPASTPAPAAAPVVPAAPVSFGTTADSWSGFLWLAVTMGALSLLTPCVFPMVPITVSYFTE